MSDRGATTTQGQSMPTALFDKMFAKDEGMPGRNELQSTIQDRSESSAKYKVGDEVWIAGNPSVVSAVQITKWGGVYTIKSGRRVLMTGATETVMEALARKETERKLKLFADELEHTIKAQECTEEQAIELRVHVEKIRSILAKASESAQ